MKRAGIVLLSGLIAAGCTIAIDDFQAAPDSAEVRVSLDVSEAGLEPGTKATLGQEGFRWKVGDVVTWVGADNSTASVTLKEADIIAPGNTAVFTAAIPGLASGDVSGYFTFNCSQDGSIPYSLSSAITDGAYSVTQQKAGTTEGSRTFLLSSTTFDTLHQGQESVKLKMRLAGTLVDFRPFSSTYTDENVQSLRLASTAPFCGKVTRNHAAGTVSGIQDASASKYDVALGTPASLSGTSSAASGIYMSLPAGSLEDFNIIVRTDKARYVFNSTKAVSLQENCRLVIPLNLDKATRIANPSPLAINLTESMVSTNSAMQYVTQGKNPDQYGYGNPDWFEPITDAQTSARTAKYGLKSNMWDNNASTCFHLNNDWGKAGTSWGCRFSSAGAQAYLQINLGAKYESIKLSAQFCPASCCALADGVEILASAGTDDFVQVGTYTVPEDRKLVIENLTTSSSQIQSIRIRSLTSWGWTYVMDAFGIAELGIWQYPSAAADPEPGEEIPEPDPEAIRTIDSPATTYFIPRRWKSGMNVSTNSWYKYWSDESGVWNTSNTNLWLPNCTHYSMGRTAEIANRPIYTTHELFNSGYANAQNWYANSKWETGSTPALGAILVWNGGEYGHVAIVEGINDDGTVNISQSGYQSTNRTFDNPKYFQYVENLTCKVGYVTTGIGWKFSGYIYNPYVNDIRVARNTACSQVYVFVDALVVRNDDMVATGLSVLHGYYNIYDKKEYNSYTWAKIADNAWIPLNESWNTVYW